MSSDAKCFVRDKVDTTEEESLSSMNGEHWEAQKELEKDEHKSEDYTNPQLEFFKNNVRAHFLHAFLEYRPSGAEGDGANKLLDGSTVQLVDLHALVQTVVVCLGEKTF